MKFRSTALATSLVVAALAIAAQASASCTYPKAPDRIPDGSKATKEEMLAAKSQVVTYNKDMETYLSCLQGEFDAKTAADTTSTPEQKADAQKMHEQKYNAAVQELQGVADRFNEQLRVWKAKNSPDKEKKTG